MRIQTIAIATALVASLTAASGALAWPGGEKPTPAQRAEHMQKTLQLDDNQRQQIQKILERSAEQRAALEQKYTIAERDKFRDEARKLRETLQSEIDAILTPAQREAFAAQRLHKGHKGMGYKGDCPRQGTAESN